ncbi:uncharacterized protein LAESUDRAFT_708199 [Laetiporus sulphureus 93-53]|uniref:Uncharacterized protein n=1 Tax=Laetiporus sulphureus 93-53 TaxID=1314785 RepID=A0A165BEE5_9APHY|nr:uncharacterized protein LAESUDRAFT_708199 [Laetiporus sulphureus 93-53]KZT00873.1 hypothetical protein LAESUDRAFT_708199 [Laetiporus sulphureus 93-53]
MPVTFKEASHPAASINLNNLRRYGNIEELLDAACSDRLRDGTEVLQSSVSAKELPMLQARSNGFVHTVMQAYNQHHCLTLRPDDVWIAILGQLSFYCNAHPDKFRSSSTRQNRKPKIKVATDASRYTVDFASVARQMTGCLHGDETDETLKRWILPDFTTTTLVDTTICSVMMMATLSAEIQFDMVCACGIPSVTLEGEKADWEKLLRRMDKLDTLGEEPKIWATMLRPILRRFISAFDGEPDLPFWEHVAHSDPSFYGADDMSGWITAFCVWSNRGKWQAGLLHIGEDGLAGSRISWKSFVGKNDSRALVLDGVPYPQMSVLFIPEGYCAVNVALSENDLDLDCVMIAGHVATAVSAEMGGNELNTVSPAPQWFIYVKGEEKPEPPRAMQPWEAPELLFVPERKEYTLAPKVAVGDLQPMRTCCIIS